MAFDLALADRVREYLAAFPELELEEKEMFSGLCFMVNGKMCVCVSGDRLMCRFDPVLQETLSEHPGYLPMTMKGHAYKGYCYVSGEYCKKKKDFLFWLDLCLAFNDQAKRAPKRKR